MTSIDILKKALGLDMQLTSQDPGFDKDNPPSVAQAILLAGLAISESIEDVGTDIVHELKSISDSAASDIELRNVSSKLEDLVKAWRES